MRRGFSITFLHLRKYAENIRESAQPFTLAAPNHGARPSKPNNAWEHMSWTAYYLLFRIFFYRFPHRTVGRKQITSVYVTHYHSSSPDQHVFPSDVYSAVVNEVQILF